MLSKTIRKWYSVNKRDLPWRDTKDPYTIWLSEIILQQTQIKQGLPYFYKFLKRFPHVRSLFEAKEDEILNLWQGLGYYSRARNMHVCAGMVMERYQGVFPVHYEELLTLKGIGEYTAAAISSFAGDEAHATLDGNVFRCLSRYYGIEIPINTVQGKKAFKELAYHVLDVDHPAEHNQALMDFGSIQCKPFSPNCSECPLQDTCQAYRQGKVHLLPVKKKQSMVKRRFFNYLVIKKSDNICLNKRIANDIWKNLYDFPLIETANRVLDASSLSLQDIGAALGNNKIQIGPVSEEYKHVLSHRIIYARFWEVGWKKGIVFPETCLWVNKTDLNRYALPKLIANYLKNVTFN